MSINLRKTAMETPNATSKKLLWTGRVLSGLVVLFLFVDGLMKALRVDSAVEGTVELGYSEDAVFGIGLTLLVCTVLYAISRTALLGAILLAGYLGGATATLVRAEDPWFVFPVILGVLAWAGLVLRDGRLWALVSWRGGEAS